jgi:alginate O-acetyltransferase complex protein AlgI
LIFSSFQFLIFFIIFLISIKFFSKQQRTIIIFFSLFFYSFWDPIFILLMIYFIFSGFYLISKNINLKFSIFIIIFPLIYFKYSGFIFDTLNISKYSFLIYDGELPLAISFVTFTILAAIIDVNKKRFKDELSIQQFSEFILYFPQLIAGPILRLNKFIPQLKKKIFFSKENFKFGLILFFIGFVKKVFFADNIGLYIDPYFENPDFYGSEDLIKAFFLFPFQIYFDFSGYVDMALGISSLLGIKMPINFNKPYLTYSLTDFWRNWHITLSSWFRDYIYIPLGGSNVSKYRHYFNLILTMSLAGLWHGANYNFIIWGFLNGIILSIEKKIKYFEKKTIIKLVINCFLIFNLWMFFRFKNLDDLINFYSVIFFNFNSIFILENFFIFFLSFILVFSQKFEDHSKIIKLSDKTNLYFICPIIFIFIMIGFIISLGQSEKFIYFNF